VAANRTAAILAGFGVNVVISVAVVSAATTCVASSELEAIELTSPP